MRRRSEIVERLGNTAYDVCVIGGGATGAGCALDAQLRGLKTLLIEAGDFGSATSTASTKLIHGGLRYLQQAVAEMDLEQYRVVRLALAERHLMMSNAPYLTRSQRFVVPCFGLVEAGYYDIGLKLYDWVAGKANLARSGFVSRAKTLAKMPWLKPDGVFGTVVYSDGQFDDARYNLALVQSCSEAGGDAINYARLESFEKSESGKLSAAIVEDRESGKRFRIEARVFVNATGPYSDQLRLLAEPQANPRLRLSKGVHILLPLPPQFGDDALLIPKTDDGRVMFAIPWMGRLLVGTTETESNVAAELLVSQAEADYLLEHLNRYLRHPYERRDIVNVMAGLRPLVQSSDARDTKKLVRDYEIEIDPKSGLISVLGGKWTVYRAMAEDTINAVERILLGRVTPCSTRDYPLHGTGAGNPPPEPQVQLPPAARAHLERKFGSASSVIAELAHLDPALMDPLVDGGPDIQAEVVYCIRKEMAVSIEDILCRRLGLQFYDWRLAARAAPVVGELLARELGWTRTRTANEIDQYVEKINGSIAAIGVEPLSTQNTR
jgi:glycerol-3-phosphate dehydrogenase